MVDNLDSVMIRASVIARALSSTVVRTIDLWLAVLSSPDSTWVHLIEKYGGGRYDDARARFPRLPRLTEFQPDVAARRSGSSINWYRRLRLWIAGLVARLIARLRRSDAQRQTLPLSRSSEFALELVARMGKPDDELGALVVVLASTPGQQQLLLTSHSSVIAAAGRCRLGISRRGDRLRVSLDRPRQVVRRTRTWLHRPRPSRGSGLVRVAALVPWTAIGVSWAVIKLIGVGLVQSLVYAVVLPGALLLAGLRAATGLAVRVSWRGRHYFSQLGGEVDVYPSDAGVQRQPVSLILGPRIFAFLAGTACLVPFAMQAHLLGQPLLSLLMNRPDLLRGEDGALQLSVDVLDTNGWVGGLALMTAASLLVLSLPTHREVEVTRLVLGHRVGLGRWWSRHLLGAVGSLTYASDLLDEAFGLAAAPLYVTARLVPLIAGAALAIGITVSLGAVWT
jgi:hypothetical protein